MRKKPRRSILLKSLASLKTIDFIKMSWQGVDFKESLENLRKPLVEKEIEFVKNWVEGELLALRYAILENKPFFTSARSFNITDDVRGRIISDFINQNKSLDGIIKSGIQDGGIIISYDIRLARV